MRQSKPSQKKPYIPIDMRQRERRPRRDEQRQQQPAAPAAPAVDETPVLEE
jgi:hypothetical protein